MIKAVCIFCLFLSVSSVFAEDTDLNSISSQKETLNKVKTLTKGDISPVKNKTDLPEVVFADDKSPALFKKKEKAFHFEKNAVEDEKKDLFELTLESSLSLNKNDLLKQPYNWSVEIPYTELELSFPIAKNSGVEAEFDFSYQNKEWLYSIDDLFVYHDLLFYKLAARIKAGYFDYPVSFTSQNNKIFSKRTLLEQNLFPSGRRAMGGLLEWNLWSFLYGSVSLQANVQKRETDLVQKMGSDPILTASLFYESGDQKAFLSYFQKDLFLKGKMQAVGTGVDLLYKLNFLSFTLKGEFWNIKRDQPHHSLLVYYLFPSVRWSFLSFGALVGGARQLIQNDQSFVWEYTLKGELDLTENFSLVVERIKEWDSIIKESTWSFSLKTRAEI